MSWFGGWFKGAFKGGALTNTDEGSQKTSPTPSRTAARNTVTDERAMKISTVFACTRLLVQSGATLPMSFYVKTAEGREALDVDHHLPQLLRYRPNNYMTAKEFRQALFTQRVLWGNGYAKIKWMGERPVSLTPLKPEYMTVQRGSSGLTYHYATQEGVKEYPQKQILHLKGWGTDGITGLSPLGYAREALGLSVAADESAAQSVDGIARATLTTDEWPTDEQKMQLRHQYGSGSTDEFRDGLAIVPGGMKYNNVGINPDDMQLLESRQWQVPELCRFFGVPAVMVDGAAGAAAAWPASYEQQVLSFLTFTLRPYLEEWEDAINHSLLQPAEQKTVYAEHEVDGLLRTDSDGRANFYSKMVQNGVMTRAEARQKENLPYVEGSDELTVQVNMTNLDDLPPVNQG